MSEADICIIGGGAAGLTAAIFAAQVAPGRKIVILDTATKLGAKILVAGGGRCNVTHDVVRPEDYNAAKNIVRNVLAAFDVPAAVRWFESMGVKLKREEGGKLFPVSDSAKTVLNALLNRCADLGVEIRGGCRVQCVRCGAGVPPANAGQRPAPQEGFLIEHELGTLLASRLILCTGGRSLPRSGSDGSGWDLARQLGHTVTPTYAALVPLVLDGGMFHAEVSGISHEAELSTFANGKLIDRRTGSLLWTHFGISGPLVMDASRHWIIARETGQNPQLRCNLIPPETFESAERWLIDAASKRPRLSIINILTPRLPERLAAAVLRHVKIDPASPSGQLPREQRRALIHALTALPLPVTGHRGWNYAEVTAGGVPLAEIDYRAMESRKQKGLYFAGEVLDCDGRIGGYNFQWAWATGYLAGRAAGA